MSEEYLEIEVKYNADDINRIAFKDLVKSFNPKTFIYVESTDIYFIRAENEFLRYRMPSQNRLGGDDEYRSELTFKKKHKDANNWVRTEVNLRVDKNDSGLVSAFCEGLGYKHNFSIEKSCDIYIFEDGSDIVFYSVKGEDGKYSNFIEIESGENNGLTHEQNWEVVLKYEKMLAPLGITAQKRKKLSLFEIYKK
jgi:adenylate cyclase class IV